MPAPLLDVICLCAAWCRTCEGYRPVLEAVAAEFDGLRVRWVDIEDEADLVGDVDIETFPTLALIDARGLRFFGPLTPEPATLRRLLRAALQDGAATPAQPAELQALAARLQAA